MKFTISSAVLNNRLQMLSKVINSKNSLPILDCFLFDVKGGDLHLTASDSENTMLSTLALEQHDGEGCFAVSNRKILEAMKELPEQPLVFDVDLNALTLQVTYQNGVYNFTVQKGEEYPVVKILDGNVTHIGIDAGELSACINRSFFATAQDELRPAMNGIFFDLTTEHLAVVATDGHKLVRNKVYSVKSEAPASFILPKKPAGLLKNVLGKDMGDIVISFNAQNAEIRFGEGVLICRLIEGKYPNYNSVIPKDNPNQLNIDRRALLSALRRVMPFASVSVQLVRLRLESGNLELSSEDLDFATSAKENIVCNYNGQNLSIGFKGSTLTEILANLESEEVNIELGDPSRAGIVVPATQPENQNVLMLIMPMLLND